MQVRCVGAPRRSCAAPQAAIRSASPLPPADCHPPTHPPQGTRNGAAAGFKLDTLLKLADVKGTDRKTSLLHFVIAQVGGRWRVGVLC